MKIKDSTSICGWYRLDRYEDGLELWKTPTKFLVCMKYIKMLQFCNTRDEANHFINNYFS